MNYALGEVDLLTIRVRVLLPTGVRFARLLRAFVTPTERVSRGRKLSTKYLRQVR